MPLIPIMAAEEKSWYQPVQGQGVRFSGLSSGSGEIDAGHSAGGQALVSFPPAKSLAMHLLNYLPSAGNDGNKVTTNQTTLQNA